MCVSSGEVTFERNSSGFPVGMKACTSKPLFSFEAILSAQLDDSLPTPSLKRLLRALKTFHPTYSTTSRPKNATPFNSQSPQSEFNHLTLSQTPRDSMGNFKVTTPILCSERQLTQPSSAKINPLDGSKRLNLQTQSRRYGAKPSAERPLSLDLPSRLRRRRRHSRRPVVRRPAKLNVKLFHQDKAGIISEHKSLPCSDSEPKPDEKNQSKKSKQKNSSFTQLVHLEKYGTHLNQPKNSSNTQNISSQQHPIQQAEQEGSSFLRKIPTETHQKPQNQSENSCCTKQAPISSIQRHQTQDKQEEKSSSRRKIVKKVMRTEEENERQHAETRQRKRPLREDSHSSPSKTPAQIGLEINKLLNELLAVCLPSQVVQWSKLRQILVTYPLYLRFCSYIDNTFLPGDTVAAGPTISQGRAIRGCVYYSDLFWEGSWKEFSKLARRRVDSNRSQASSHTIETTRRHARSKHSESEISKQ